MLWVGFPGLADAVTQVLADPGRLLSEQGRFLLTELVALYESDGLLSSDDTVIVAARRAWPEYQQLHAYICKPNRSFREGLIYFGFYADKEIKATVARIQRHYTAVPFSHAEADRRSAHGADRVADIIRGLLKDGTRVDGQAHDVFLLTGPDDTATTTLRHAVTNDTLTAAGKPWAWTLGQRYTRHDKLVSGIRHTSQL